jgi:diaminopimelate decarboxylase
MELSWQVLHQLEKDYGDSFYLLDIRQFESNYREFLHAFRSIYPKSNIGYSYKTNYTPRLCQSVNSLGGYAEVVSQMEYDIAIGVGVPPSRIIFNGPLKEKENIENAIRAGSLVNLDSLQEVFIVEALARRWPDLQIAVGLRCNFDIGTNRISRFGFDVEAGELDYAFNTFKSLNNCVIEGLHCHFATSHRSLESYGLRTKNILELSEHYFKDQPPRFIDVGGGFFGKMSETLSQQFDCPIPSYQDYAEVIATQFRNRFSPDSGPELILEPGVAIVADVMKFVGKVVTVKTVRSRKIALVTGSIQNIKPTLTDKKKPLIVYKNHDNGIQGKIMGLVDLVGYTCMEHDCLYEDYQGEIGIGDYVVFENVGAYTTVFKPPFIRPNPPIITYDSIYEEYALSRRREASQDVLCTYII